MDNPHAEGKVMENPGHADKVILSLLLFNSSCSIFYSSHLTGELICHTLKCQIKKTKDRSFDSVAVLE